jgi:hypothetical protein
MFEFLSFIDKKKYNRSIVNRLNLRQQFIIKPFQKLIEGARVLDLASHDGRWCYAFAQAGAREVVGIEGRPELVKQFEAFPNAEIKRRVKLNVGDIFEGTRKLVEDKQTFDVVGILGVYYHIMDHFGLLKLAHLLNPRIIIIDSVFLTESEQVIRVGYEDTANDLASIPQVANQEKAVIGIASQSAMECMAGALGYRVEWLDWNTVPADRRDGAADYYRPGRSRRFTCALWPI